ncbi:MAG TPA: oxidoreductase, partial [Mariniphaga sp.]|nr:oxidoreductase [Mariniphaga sp.]
NQEISEGVHLISFKRDYEFIPGQVIKIALDNQHPPRIYSICSGNKDSEISVLFNIKKGGLVTPRMAALIPGEKILASAPYGNFLGNDDPAWWIATGTGIAPFYSMLQSGYQKNKKLIHGVRFLNQFYFEDEFEASFNEQYIRCCSREPSCNTFHGRITDYIQQLDTLPDLNYFLCGSAIMVVEVRDLLISKGVPFTKIMSEIYF